MQSMPFLPDVYTFEKSRNFSTKDKFHLKCDIFDGSIVKVLRQPILYSFVSDKPPEYKVLCQLATVHKIKITIFCSFYYNILFGKE